jgi:hypothetical protein
MVRKGWIMTTKWSEKVGFWSDNGQKRLDYGQIMVKKGWIKVIL